MKIAVGMSRFSLYVVSKCIIIIVIEEDVEKWLLTVTFVFHCKLEACVNTVEVF